MSRSRQLSRIAALTVAGLGLLVIGLLLRPSETDLLQPHEVKPPGRWHFQSSQLAKQAAGQELARVMSLPYVAGRKAAPARQGVVLHRPAATFEGLNLYVSGHGPEAILVDMEGAVVHTWSVSFESAFPARRPTIETPFYRRAHLFPNGDLLVLFQGGGMIRLDRDSRLLWSSELPFYNHLSVTEEGHIVSIAKTARRIPSLRADQAVLEDSIVILTADGTMLNRLSLVDCFASSAFADLIHPVPLHADIFHTNTALRIASSDERPGSPWVAGDLLVSLREVDIVAVIDPELETVRAAWRGPWRAQHQPVPVSGRTFLLFDNRGASGSSRVIEFDPRSEQILWEFTGPETAPLASPEAGSVQRLPNGNILITDSEQGRALEITSGMEPVWEFLSPHRAGQHGELVATLFEVVRIPMAGLEFLASQVEN